MHTSRKSWLEAHGIIWRTGALALLALALMAGAAIANPIEQVAYKQFFLESHAVSIPESAIGLDGTAVVMFPLDGVGRGVTLELDLSEAGAGDYLLNLANLSLIVAPTLDGEGRLIDASELPGLLAEPDARQDVFCRNTDGFGGAVAWAQVQAISATGDVLSLQVLIGNDGLMHPGQEVIGECSAEAGTFGEALGDATTSAAKEERVWCISWPSKDCPNKRCNGQTCKVTLSSLAKLAAENGLTIPGGKTLIEAIAWLEEQLGFGIGGYCGKVYLLGVLSLGCQCVMHTF